LLKAAAKQASKSFMKRGDGAVLFAAIVTGLAPNRSPGSTTPVTLANATRDDITQDPTSSREFLGCHLTRTNARAEPAPALQKSQRRHPDGERLCPEFQRWRAKTASILKSTCGPTAFLPACPSRERSSAQSAAILFDVLDLDLLIPGQSVALGATAGLKRWA
jgi:hypothetical protein